MKPKLDPKSRDECALRICFRAVYLRRLKTFFLCVLFKISSFKSSFNILPLSRLLDTLYKTFSYHPYSPIKEYSKTTERFNILSYSRSLNRRWMEDLQLEDIRQSGEQAGQRQWHWKSQAPVM